MGNDVMIFGMNPFQNFSLFFNTADLYPLDSYWGFIVWFFKSSTINENQLTEDKKNEFMEFAQNGINKNRDLEVILYSKSKKTGDITDEVHSLHSKSSFPSMFNAITNCIQGPSAIDKLLESYLFIEMLNKFIFYD